MGVIKLIFGDIISIIFNVGMIVGGLWLGYLLMDLSKKLNEHKKVFETWSRVQGRLTDGDFNENGDLEKVVKSSLSTDDANSWKEVFDGYCADYNKYTELIPIFPLIGIFGTVLGLAGQAAKDPDQMMAYIGLAMSTTIVALFVTIVLKFLTALYTSKELYSCDVKYESYMRYKEDKWIRETKKDGKEGGR